MGGNSKLGSVPNVSLLPITSCDKSIGCAKCSECYAVKFAKLRKNVRNAWSKNTDQAKRPASFFRLLRTWFDKYNPSFFRWFVAGDAPSLAFMRRIVEFAADHPDTKFLVFTKRYAWVNAVLAKTDRPANLALVFSAWPGTDVPNPNGLPVAWMRDNRDPDPRIPDDALECPGGCEGCGMCWNLPAIKRDVVFDKH